VSLRATLHASFSLVRSIEANRSTASITFAHVLDAQIKMLKEGEKRVISDPGGDSMGDRVSRWNTLDALQKDLESMIAQLEQTKGDPNELTANGVYEASEAPPGASGEEAP
jgi:hypothetical protein